MPLTAPDSLRTAHLIPGGYVDIIKAIDKKVGEVRTESIDISVGELIALHQQKELVIQPDFQRLLRWSMQQRSRLVESLLLELPIPSIFVIEKESGVFELIDGLQRIGSLLHFIDPSSLHLEDEEEEEDEDAAAALAAQPDVDEGEQFEAFEEEEFEIVEGSAGGLVLEGCDLVEELNGQTFDDLPLTLRLRLKRTPIRTVVIKRQSGQFLRYEMFKRLNTGGSKLSDQDIRNVNARMLGEEGAAFYRKLQKCARFAPFLRTIELLPTTAWKNRLHEELVLRFFATKNYREHFRGNVGDWLDEYMEAVLLHGAPFGPNELQDFHTLFVVLAEKFGEHAFVKYRGGAPLGGVAPAYFEAVTIGAMKSMDRLLTLKPEQAKKALAQAVESQAFRKVTGPGANSLPKLELRIDIIATAFANA
jgi:hypothetical protein